VAAASDHTAFAKNVKGKHSQRGITGSGISHACSTSGAAEHNPHCNGGTTSSGQMRSTTNSI